MANMSYCRFENTLRDLQDCLHHMNDEDDEDMSASEREARRELILLCGRIAERCSDLLEEPPPVRLEDNPYYCEEHGGHLRDSPACDRALERDRRREK